MSRYKVTLEPIDWFFFGGEQTFDNGASQSFIARSNRMPQQTTLLGMVRYQLLKKSGLLPLSAENADAAESLIGISSFDITRSDVTFGRIRSLSQVFIEKGDRALVPVPLNFGYNCSFDDHTRLWLSGFKHKGIIKTQKENGKDYDDKEYWKRNNYSLLVDNEGHSVSSDGLYLSKMQIGITKGRGRDEDKHGFFKQETLRFKDKDTHFAFYLELDGDGLIEDDYVFIGAQRSCFKMVVKPSDEQPVVPHHEQGTILLLSPTYIADVESFNSLVRFHWSYSIPFRNFVGDPKGTLRSGDIAYRRHGSVCTMLAAGSVLFYEEDSRKALEKLLAQPHLQQIGNNKYDII